MLLTIKQPTSYHSFKSVHEYSPPTPPATSRFSPTLNSADPAAAALSADSKVLPPLPATSRQVSQLMSTPHRGLPPPAAMTLPQPAPGPPPIGQPPPLSQPMGQLPAPPQQWQGAEESMRQWLQAKSEEDKRKQEEEKTRQESLRLEQRKIEQDMLRTSLNGGIPPYLIPMVFAGMGGGNLPNASLEWAQHYMAQAHQLQQQQLQPPSQQQQQQPLLPPQGAASPELRRESRQIGQIYGASQHQPSGALAATPAGALGPPQTSTFLPSYPLSPGSRSRASLPGPGALARQPQTPHLPRLNTGEMHIQPPPSGPSGQPAPGPSSHALQQSQPPQQETQSSPSIYFHHWQPPTSQAGPSGSNQPTTPSDPSSASPKKRKAQGPQQPAPPPSSQPQYTSPPFSQGGSSSTSGTPSGGRRRGHSRQRSDLSTRALDSHGRPTSRHRHAESGASTQSGFSSGQPPVFESTTTSVSEEAPSHTRSHPSSSQERASARFSQYQEHSYSEAPESRRSDESERRTSARPPSKRNDTRD